MLVALQTWVSVHKLKCMHEFVRVFALHAYAYVCASLKPDVHKLKCTNNIFVALVSMCAVVHLMCVHKFKYICWLVAL